MSFGGLILIGAILLTLPVSARHGRADIIDALFTSTSAVCVTGLTVLDTGVYFNGFGQAVILGLIQLGGFGIISFGTFITFVIGGRASFKVRETMHETFPDLTGLSLRRMLVRAVYFIFVIEAAGALILFFSFGDRYPAGEKIWQSVFHSVSAFCNAGFSLNSDNLIGFADNTMVNLAIMSLIITGGIGFVVLLEMEQVLLGARKLKRISLHSKMVLVMTVILIVLGAVLITGFEWKYQFSDYSIKGKLLRGFFQSVTARTCGFNSVEIGALSEASIVVLIGLMFIGGAPGSTAGGVKVTSAGVIIILLLSLFRSEKKPSVFGRSLSRETIDRALLLCFMAFFLVNGVAIAMMIFEGGMISALVWPGIFTKLIFESTSAFGTVGLTMGVTPILTDASKLLLTALMFLGRLGPLTMIYVLQGRGQSIDIEYPEEDIMIG